MIIGLPRALFYWKQPYFWETFFEELGFKVLLSPLTNKEIVEMGVKVADPETCFSVKTLYGHILALEGKVDLVFIPRLKKNEFGLEYCPKFFALPDLFSHLITSPIISIWIDLKKESFPNTLLKLAKKLGKRKKIAKKAIEKSFLRQKEEKEKIEKEYFKKICSSKKKIVLISHPYNLYDEYLNLRIKEKLEKLGGEVIFIEEVPQNSRIYTNLSINKTNIREISSKISEHSRSPKFHWEFGKEIMEKVQEVLKYNKTCPVRNQRFSNGVAGAIEISSFACGCDAVLKEFVEKEFKQSKVPFLYLIIDEHTGEAGFQTRLEAFMDTL